MSKPDRVGAASGEFVAAELGDSRLTRRLLKIADAVADSPSDSFPQIARSDGELEGVYRFLSNERVTPGAILAPHFEATRQRSRNADILVVHDTTEFTFNGWAIREGLGRISTGPAQGFFGHFALAVAADGSRRPLGVIGLKPIVRTEPPAGLKRSWDLQKKKNKESRRWTALAKEVDERLGNPIHVMDREADSFEILANMISSRSRFVIRLCHDRTLVDENGKEHGALFAELSKSETVLTRTVPLSRRTPGTSAREDRIHPPRLERSAQLRVKVASVEVRRPPYGRLNNKLPRSLQVNVILVEEVDAPPGNEPVSWKIVTSEPTATRAQVEAVIDAYRARWVIEEFFKALKTGCSYTKRQLESLHALLNALAVFSVIAWRLLLLRSTARLTPQAPASHTLTGRQLKVLRELSHMDEPGVPHLTLPSRPTAQDALFAVARLGGHITNNGPPGWQVLGRGFESLLLIELGWRASENSRARCDQ